MVNVVAANPSAPAYRIHDSDGERIDSTNTGLHISTLDNSGSVISPLTAVLKENTFTQLTAPGVTIGLDVSIYSKHTLVYKIANINTNVVVRGEGSTNGTDWFNLNDAEIDTTKLSNGTYKMHKSNFRIKFIRFNFVSESGGTSATIDVVYNGGN